MPRWPALARPVRRPSPLVADVALAIVLAGLSLLTLVLAGLAIRRFEPARASLEERFLEITSRLEEAA